MIILPIGSAEAFKMFSMYFHYLAELSLFENNPGPSQEFPSPKDACAKLDWNMLSGSGEEH